MQVYYVAFAGNLQPHLSVVNITVIHLLIANRKLGRFGSAFRFGSFFLTPKKECSVQAGIMKGE
jgi:hypothetical protein